MTAPLCACGCGRPSPSAYARRECAQTLSVALMTAVGHAEDTEAVIARQTRYGAGPGPRGGGGEGLNPDLRASARLDRIAATVTTWARHADEHGGARLPHWRPLAGPECPIGWCEHPSCATIRTRRPPTPLGWAAGWLATQTDWLRSRPEAGEAFADLHEACDDLARLVDRPADRDLVGVCDCGSVLYAVRGRPVVSCRRPTCRLRWNVAESRGMLERALRERLFTAAECARLAAFWADRTQPQIRALITAWTRPDRVRLTARGWSPNEDYGGDDEPAGWELYRLGDVLDLLAQTPRRARRSAA